MTETRPPFVCAACGTIDENVRATLGGLEQTIRTQALKIVALEKSLHETREKDPMSARIREVLDYFKGHPRRPHPRMKGFALDGSRAGHVRRALKNGYDVGDCKKAIDGIARFPYVTDDSRLPGKRATTGKQADLHDDVEHALSTDERIRRAHALADMPDEAQTVRTVPLATAAPAQGSGCRHCRHCWEERNHRARQGRIKKVRELLAAYYGEGAFLLGWMQSIEYWRCPNCTTPDGNMFPLAVYLKTVAGAVVECEHCKITTDGVVERLERLVAAQAIRELETAAA
jgi:hypothetical protein